MSLALAPLPDLTPDEAQTLTAKIKAHISQAWVLICEAHERRAHLALGYATFGEYVGAEFDLSRSRAYQLIDQGRVIRELADAAGVSTSVDTEQFTPVTEAEARDIKPRLAEVTDHVAEKVAAGTPAPEAIREAVAQARADRQAIRDLNALAPEGFDPEADRARAERCQTVFMAAEEVLGLGDPTVIVAELADHHAYHLPDVEAAGQWLTDFAHAWKDRQ